MVRRAAWLGAVLWVLGCGGQAPAPFDPAADCPKEENCGQCASRGACAWCGDPADGARGQCVAIGRAECAAPSAWAKTPDVCAAPPAESVKTTAATTSESPVAKALGAPRYAAIQKTLASAFPSARVTDDVIAAVATVLHHHPRAGEKPATDRAPVARPVREKEHRLYLGQANHHRVRSMPPASRPMQSQFMLQLPMVRVSLPEQLAAGKETIATEIGDVDLRNDHLLGSIDVIAAKYVGAGRLAARPERVDLITPARAQGSRFGAIAVYLGYRKKTDRGPSFYLLEAGTATGAAKMIYFSPDMKPIQSVTSYYLPTPFVSMRNTYSGGVTMKPAPEEDEPEQLVVESRAPGEKDPYITVTVRYQRAPTFSLPLPIELTADAGARVSLIAEAMGLRNAEELEPVLAGLAVTLHWIEFPHYTDGKAAPPPR
jgi:hypothetical protein